MRKLLNVGAGSLAPATCAIAAALGSLMCFAPAARACVVCPEHQAPTGDSPTGDSQTPTVVFTRPSSSLLAPQTVNVHVFNFDFSSSAIGQPITDPTIFAGDTIHWTWDGGTHTVTSVAGSIEAYSSGTKSSGSFDHTFASVGSYQYFCVFHGGDNGNGTTTGMAGTITVLPVPEPGSAAVFTGLIAAAMLRRRR